MDFPTMTMPTIANTGMNLQQIAPTAQPAQPAANPFRAPGAKSMQAAQAQTSQPIAQQAAQPSMQPHIQSSMQQQGANPFGAQGQMAAGIQNTPQAPAGTKSKIVATLLCWFLGLFGVHRFYVGKWKTGLIQFFTLGGLLIWALIDLVRLLTNSFRDSEGQALS